MVMQFGLMVFFAPAFPLAALFSLINNVIEIRSDAFKMCYLFQRPFGERVSNIGTWQVRPWSTHIYPILFIWTVFFLLKNVLEVFSTLGIIVNCGLLITYGTINKLFPSVGFYESIAIAVIIEVEHSISFQNII